jgi:hypothetical protein
MDCNKRGFLVALFSGLVAAPLALFVSRGLAQQPGGMKQQSPFPPRPGDVDGADDAPKVDPKQIQERNQREIRKDVEKLFALAEELKTEVEKTDSTSVLSLQLVQKAREVEKMAHQIANLAVG